jgi:hypothetical protein
LWSCRARLDGYRSALLRAGLPVDEALVRCGELCAEAGRLLAGQLLGLATPPTAIMGGNDAQAFRRAAGAQRARVARAHRRQRDRVRRPAHHHLGHPAADHDPEPLAAMAATAFTSSARTARTARCRRATWSWKPLSW